MTQIKDLGSLLQIGSELENLHFYYLYFMEWISESDMEVSV